MPVYPFFCDCGFEIELEGSVENMPVPPNCPTCKQPTFRDYSKQNIGFSMGDFMCQQRTGYATDWFDAEEYRQKTGQKCTMGAGTDYGFPKDPHTGRIIKKKKGRKVRSVY